MDNGFIKLELSFVTTFDEGQIITFQVADHEIENWNVKAFIWKHYEEIKCCRTDCCIPAAHRNSYLKRLMASKFDCSFSKSSMQLLIWQLKRKCEI